MGTTTASLRLTSPTSKVVLLLAHWREWNRAGDAMPVEGLVRSLVHDREAPARDITPVEYLGWSDEVHSSTAIRVRRRDEGEGRSQRREHQLLVLLADAGVLEYLREL